MRWMHGWPCDKRSNHKLAYYMLGGYLSEVPQDTKIVGLLLIDVARILRKRFDQNCRGTGLTRAQWQVLSSLYHNEGMTQGALAERLEVEPITIGRIIDRLETAGMLERRAHPTDRRAW